MRVRLMLVIAAVGGSLALAAPAAHAFGVANNCTTPTNGSGTTLSPNQPCWVAGVYNNDYTGMNDIQYIGAPAQVSGGHPFTGVTDFTMSGPSPAVTTVRVDVPPGLVSNPVATPDCNDAGLAAGTCPGTTQLGIVRLNALQSGILSVFAVEDVYNMPVESSQCPNTSSVEYVSDFAFYVAATKTRVNICGSVEKQPPYNQFFTIALPPNSPATLSSTLIFWGVPGDSGHDPQRGKNCLGIGSPCSIPASGPSHPSGTAFITNPTACLPSGQVTTLTLGGAGGASSMVTSKTPVPAINCASLPFAPKLKLALKGASQTKPGKHPTVIANLSQTLGEANVGFSQVTLPLSLALDPKNSQHVCSPTAAFNDACPSKTLIGSARLTTPVLNQPLTGKVYLVQGIACSTKATPSLLGVCPSGQAFHTTPALLVALRGQAMIDLHAQTTVAHNKFLVTTFSNLPDLPESSFQLTVNGGKRGVIVVTGNKNLCSYKKQLAPTVFTGKNGKTVKSKLKMSTPCKK